MCSIADIQSLNSLYEVCELPDEEFEEWLASLGLLALKRTCWKCGAKMSVYRGRRKPGRKKFQCPRHHCRKASGFYKGTFFEGSFLKPKEIMLLSWHWVTGNLSYASIQKEMTRTDNSVIAASTIVDWFNFFREFCAECLKNYPIVIGGAEVTVELRQTIFSLRGCDLHLLLGIERESKNSFIAPIDNGKDPTIMYTQIERHIHEGTTVLSDCWKICGGVENLPDGFSKYTVIDSKEFPEGCASEIYKKMVNEAWYSFVYEKNHRSDKMSPNMFSYVMEFLWKLQFPMEKRFSIFWNHVRMLYPL